MASVSAAAKIDEYLPPACPQFLPLTRFLPHSLCAADSPNQIFAGAKFCGSDLLRGNRPEYFRRSVSSSAVDDRYWQCDALRLGYADATATTLTPRTFVTASYG